MKTVLCSLALLTLASAVPSQYEADRALFQRAPGDSCKASEGSGTCQSTSKCAGISYPQNLCPADPEDVQCCVTIKCDVPSSGSGFCRSRANNGCAGGSFHSGFCPGSDDIQCCVKKGGSDPPPPTTPPPTTPPPAADPCTPALADKLTFDTPISDFLAAKSAQNPSCFIWTDDGCSCSPDAVGEYDFLPACKRHDFGYRNNKKLNRFDAALKKRVDENLRDDMYDVCNKFSGWESYKGVECRRIADIYVTVVENAGSKNKRGLLGVSKTSDLLQKRECDIFRRDVGEIQI